ncbi:hypothetical protein [Dactylosporangium sp. NPDC005555]|uniref:hypothetical protein n=1 Tax=Dactylosporangium sp. NPDC005555 TaxID=3154889 RepID=UPI0033AACF76
MTVTARPSAVQQVQPPQLLRSGIAASPLRRNPSRSWKHSVLERLSRPPRLSTVPVPSVLIATRMTAPLWAGVLPSSLPSARSRCSR